MRWALFVFAWLIGLSPWASSRAEEPAARTASAPHVSQAPGEIEARVAALLAKTPPEPIRAPLAQAELALARVRERKAAGDERGAERSFSLARAALALAEARSALLRERELFVSAGQRRKEAEQREAAARAALAQEKQAGSAAKSDGRP